MDRRLTDFSIDHILRAEASGTVALFPAGYLADTFFQRPPGGFPVERAPTHCSSVPVQLTCVRLCYDPYWNAPGGPRAAQLETSHKLPMAHHRGYQAAMATPAALRRRSRERTVFTEAQTKQLEALFAVTQYPAAEVRAQLAQSIGLREDIVRVWFKNCRARRKRSKVPSPSPQHWTATKENIAPSQPSSEL